MTATVWFNGRLIDGPLSVDASDRGLLLGDGLFETLAVFNRHAVWRAEHLDRLVAGAGTLGIPIDRAGIEAAIAQVLRASAPADGILRVSLTRGPGVRGLAAEGERPSLLVTLAPWTRGMIFAPAKLVTSTIRRNETSPASRLKTLSYIDSILAAREAAASGCDDALLLNGKGDVAATTIANIFILKGGRLVTPPVAAGILPGIARRKILDLAGAEERMIAPEELRDADAVFLTNSLRLIRPVSHFDGRKLRCDAAALEKLLDGLCRLIARETGIDPRRIDQL